MGGICGWIGADTAAAARRAETMARALDHRGRIAVLSAEPGTPELAVDAPLMAPPAVEEAWARLSGDPAGFAASLEGPCALAALDRGRDRLLLVRDRLGERPLYFCAVPGGVAFASEIKALRTAGAVPEPSIAPEALDAYLAFTYVPAPWTMLRGVVKVPAGHCVEFDLRAGGEAAGSARRFPYWRIPDRTGAASGPRALLELLDEALARRLPAGGPPGVLLSGGLDSSVVLALAARRSPSPACSFSIRFAEEDLDESSHARRVARLFGSDHHEILLKEVDAATVGRVLHHLDEPHADAAAIPAYILAREAAGGFSVLMTGDGADALLAGDHWFRRVARLDALGRWPAAARAGALSLVRLAGRRPARRLRDLVGLLGLPGALRYLAIRQKWTPEERLAIYSEDLRRRVDPSRTAATYAEAPVAWRSGASVDAALRTDALHGLPEGLLMKSDKMGAAHRVELRSPFMDQRVVEWAARADLRLLLRGSVSKYLLKQAAATLLPKDLVNRRKQGLQVPLERWLKGSLRDMTEEAFSEGLIRRQGIFDAGALAILERRFAAGPAGPALTGRVWQIVAFQTWWRQVFEGAR